VVPERGFFVRKSIKVVPPESEGPCVFVTICRGEYARAFLLGINYIKEVI